MPDLAPFHREFVFVHILGVFAFLLAHGVSAGVMFRIRRVRDPGALRALLDLSSSSLTAMYAAALVILGSGILAGFSGNYWTTGRFWLWASLGIFLAVVVVMGYLGREPMERVRQLVGDGSREIDQAAVESAIAMGRPMLVAAIGFGTVAVLTWLMMYKPF